MRGVISIYTLLRLKDVAITLYFKNSIKHSILLLQIISTGKVSSCRDGLWFSQCLHRYFYLYACHFHQLCSIKKSDVSGESIKGRSLEKNLSQLKLLHLKKFKLMSQNKSEIYNNNKLCSHSVVRLN